MNISGRKPYYSTALGKAYLGDAKELLANKSLAGKVDLIVTSPPFALQRKKEYGNVEADKYVAWFLEFAKVFHTILKEKGSLAIDIGGSWNQGEPTRSLYQYDLLLQLCRMPEHKFYLAQEFFWYNPAKLPTPAEWVTVRRERVKDAVNIIWWLSKVPHPKASNLHVLQPYSDRMEALLKNGYKAMLRPSGHDISTKFSKRNAGAIPSNFLVIANTESNSTYQRLCRENKIKPHPARFPALVPEFFIKMMTDEGDLVVDPFAGSNVTGEVCERLKRKWIATDIQEKYLKGSRYRFNGSILPEKEGKKTKRS